MQTDAVKGKNAIHPGRKIALEIVGIVVSIIFLLPFLIVVLNACRTNGEIINSAVGIPQNPANFFTNLSDVWNSPVFNFITSFRDSVVITALSLAVISLFSAMTAWVLVRNKTRWSNFLFLMFVAAMVIPFQVVMFPLLRLLWVLTTRIRSRPFARLRLGTVPPSSLLTLPVSTTV